MVLLDSQSAFALLPLGVILGAVVRLGASVFGWIAAHKDLWSSLQSIAVVGGALAGYVLFVRKRQIWPRGDLTHRISHRALGDGTVLLRVEAVIVNRGNVLIEGWKALTRVQQVRPVYPEVGEKLKRGEKPTPRDCAEIAWPLLDKSELQWPDDRRPEVEPGETESIPFDFIIPTDVATVQIYTHIWNVKKRRGGDIGWSATTLYDVTSPRQLTAGEPAGGRPIQGGQMSLTDGKDRSGDNRMRKAVEPDLTKQLHLKPEPDLKIEQLVVKPEPPPVRPAPVGQGETPKQE